MPEDELQQLRARLAEAETIIAALRSGEVDAIVGEHQVTLVRLQQSEQALRESETRFRRLVDANIIGVVIADTERIIEANDIFLGMVGYSHEDLEAGRIDWRAMTPADHAPRDERGLQQLLDRGTCDPFEKEYYRKDGTRVPVLIGASRLTREPPTWICFVLDLTEFKQTEQALRELNQTLEERVAERTGMLKLLNDVATAANEARSVDEAFEYALKRVSEHNGWSFGHAYLLEEGEPPALAPVRTSYEAAPGRFRRFRAATLRTRLRAGQGLPGQAWATKGAQWADNVDQELIARRAQVGSELGIRCGAAFPIFVGEEVVGVLEFFSDKQIERTNRLLESMASIGTQLGRVVERQRFERNLARALLVEQRRVGQDLHDAVGQEIAGLALIAQRMARQTERGTPPDATALSALSDGLRHALEDTRALVRDLLPPAVTYADTFVDSLQELAAGVSERYNVVCEVVCPRPVSIEASEAAVHLYRIAAEAMTNAAKHARARRIVLQLAVENDMLVLEVRDDGVGIPTDADIKGSGLWIMQHRANVIGATLHIRRGAEGGTIVRCALPEDQLRGTGSEEA
jgi:PAS domain S-box-containing protein